ncbi:MAG: YggS family pyridoxal phosphate-dependent enzyme [Myxococcaceae bacterium]|nr:YggS family pyridoxal phosphate-dependent enzyme [Myxococcaceae bacterium]
MSGVAENLEAVRQRIARACARAGRSPDEVTLVAVSKLQPASLIEEAVRAGQRDFGENYAQELRDKAAALAGLEGLRWHAIGPLQTNKAKYVAPVAHAFHALDRVEIARELARRRRGAPPLKVFLEVNVGGEATKNGVTPEEAPALLEKVRALPELEVVGLMTLPPPAADPDEARPHFRRLAALARALGLRELSMGTTADFEVAIEEGATVVRVGTAIFGERPKKAGAVTAP